MIEFYLIYGVLLLICGRQGVGNENFGIFLSISGCVLSIIGIVKAVI